MASLMDMTQRFADEIAQIGDEGAVQAALDDASALMAGYLGAVPASHPLMISLACDIARYRLHRDVAPEAVKDRYQAALSVLKSVAAGDVSLAESLIVSTEGDTSATTSGGLLQPEATAFLASSPRRFSFSSMSGF